MTESDWGVERYNAEVLKVIAKIEALPAASIDTEKLLALIEHFPPAYKNSTFDLLRTGFNAHALAKYQADLEQEKRIFQMTSDLRRESRAFWAGFAFLILALLVSIFAPTIRPMTELILRVMAGAGVGMMIAFLPGLFSVDSKLQVKNNKVVIRATGGFAALVVIYLFDPGWISSLFHFGK